MLCLRVPCRPCLHMALPSDMCYPISSGQERQIAGGDIHFKWISRSLPEFPEKGTETLRHVAIHPACLHLPSDNMKLMTGSQGALL